MTEGLNVVTGIDKVFDKNSTKPFAIDTSIPRLVQGIIDARTDKKVIFNAPTGSGKSIATPYYLYNNAKLFTNLLDVNKVRVVIALPTVVAVMKAYSSLKRRGILPGRLHFRAGGKGKYDKNNWTGILYATAEHVSNQFIRVLEDGGKMKDFADIYIADEYHTLSPPTLEVEALWDAQNPENRPVYVKMSATGISSEPDNEIIIESNVPSRFKKDVAYLTGDNKTPGNLNAACVMMVKFLLALMKKLRYDNFGNIILFFPTVASATMSRNNFTRALKGVNLKTLIAHSNMTPDDRNILGSIREGSNYIIFSTNILESSVTVPGARYIFDSMYENHVVYNKYGGTTSVVRLISRSSAEQRAGRTGRTNDGVVYRMITEADFTNNSKAKGKRRLRDRDEPRLDTIDSKVTMLRLMKAKVNPSKLFLDSNVGDLFLENLRTLGEIGAVRFVEESKIAKLKNKVQVFDSDIGHYAITDLGLFASKMGLDVRESRLLYNYTVGLGRSEKLNIYPILLAVTALSQKRLILTNKDVLDDSFDVCIKILKAAHASDVNIDPQFYVNSNPKRERFISEDSEIELLTTFKRLSSIFTHKGSKFTVIRTDSISPRFYLKFAEADYLRLDRSGKYWKLFSINKGHRVELPGKVLVKGIDNIEDKDSQIIVYRFVKVIEGKDIKFKSLQVYYHNETDRLLENSKAFIIKGPDEEYTPDYSAEILNEIDDKYEGQQVTILPLYTVDSQAQAIQIPDVNQTFGELDDEIYNNDFVPETANNAVNNVVDDMVNEVPFDDDIAVDNMVQETPYEQIIEEEFEF